MGVVRAAMLAVPVLGKLATGVGVELVFSREDEPRAGTGTEEPRPVNLARPCQGNRLAALLHHRDAMHAVIARAANVQNLLVGVDRLLALRLAVRVPQPAVLQRLHLHAARVQRHDLVNRTRRAGHKLAECVAPQADVHHHLLSPLKRGLPCVRLRVQLAVQRNLAGEPLAAARRPL